LLIYLVGFTGPILTDVIYDEDVALHGAGTLTAGTTTTVLNANCTTYSKAVITPTSAAMAALMGGAYISAYNVGGFIITHATAAGTETFDYVIT